MKKILIFMNTYNGQDYLRSQLESILYQENVDVYLAIRDDGSTDETCTILDEYKNKYPQKFQIIRGENVGVKLSEQENLLLSNKDGFDYYAFSDHDDVWLKDKLIKAVKMLNKLDSDKPALYYSNLAVTDKYLNYKFNVYGKNKIAATPESCFVDFAASANTFVFNKLALEAYINDFGLDKFWGDVWFQFLVYYIGNVVYDDIPHILFRRTGSNVSGSRDQGIKLWIQRIKKIKKESGKNNVHMHSSMARYLIDNYSTIIDNDKLNVLNIISHCNDSFKCKIKLLFNKQIRSKSLSRNITFHGRLLLNLL